MTEGELGGSLETYLNLFWDPQSKTSPYSIYFNSILKQWDLLLYNFRGESIKSN